MSVSGKGCMAIGGEEKDGTKEEGIFVVGGLAYIQVWETKVL